MRSLGYVWRNVVLSRANWSAYVGSLHAPVWTPNPDRLAVDTKYKIIKNLSTEEPKQSIALFECWSVDIVLESVESFKFDKHSEIRIIFWSIDSLIRLFSAKPISSVLKEKQLSTLFFAFLKSVYFIPNIICVKSCDYAPFINLIQRYTMVLI